MELDQKSLMQFKTFLLLLRYINYYPTEQFDSINNNNIGSIGVGEGKCQASCVTWWSYNCPRWMHWVDEKE